MTLFSLYLIAEVLFIYLLIYLVTTLSQPGAVARSDERTPGMRTDGGGGGGGGHVRQHSFVEIGLEKPRPFFPFR